MHGLIFVTWEKYLTERFGHGFLSTYRGAIGEAIANAPLASKLYDDATLLAGVGAASQLSGLSAERLLREYGHYFIINGLTGHLCTYVLSQVHSGRDLPRQRRNSSRLPLAPCPRATASRCDHHVQCLGSRSQSTSLLPDHIVQRCSTVYCCLRLPLAPCPRAAASRCESRVRCSGCPFLSTSGKQTTAPPGTRASDSPADAKGVC